MCDTPSSATPLPRTDGMRRPPWRCAHPPSVSPALPSRARAFPLRPPPSFACAPLAPRAPPTCCSPTAFDTHHLDGESTLAPSAERWMKRSTPCEAARAPPSQERARPCVRRPPPFLR
eukprot:6024720-Prymnesium_polylepis.1